jgi:hypothetical protein
VIVLVPLSSLAAASQPEERRKKKFLNTAFKIPLWNINAKRGESERERERERGKS